MTRLASFLARRIAAIIAVILATESSTLELLDVFPRRKNWRLCRTALVRRARKQSSLVPRSTRAVSSKGIFRTGKTRPQIS